MFKRLILIALAALLNTGRAEAQEDSVTSEEIVRVKYFNENNQLQYLKIESLLKTGKKTEPIKGKSFDLYIDSITAENLLAHINTGKTGIAKAILPPGLKAIWDAEGTHTFLVTKKGEEAETIAELEIVKGKIVIDTASADGARSVTVQAFKWENDDWVPVPEVEMRVGVQRLGGILSAGDEPTYTTDSSGSVTVDFTRDSLPGDTKGNILLVAKVEDNDVLGNLLVEKNVTWGIPRHQENNFFAQRTLWSTRNRTPLWLLFIAYSIIATVWGTLVYLVFQFIKIRRLGKQASRL